MEKYSYSLRPVTDNNDVVLYYEFVRMVDDAILCSSRDFDFLLSYAVFYVTAINKSLIVE